MLPRYNYDNLSYRPIRTVLQLGMGWFPDQAGGLNRYFFGLHKSLEDLGISVNGLVVANGQCGSSSVEAYALRNSGLAGRLFAGRSAIRRKLLLRPEVIVSHFALYAFSAIDLIQRLPFVVHFHGPWAEEKRKEGDRGVSCTLKALMERTVYRRAHRVITLSQCFADVANRQYGVPRDRLRVIPGGVDTVAFRSFLTRAHAREVLEWPQDRPIVLCVRRLVPRMGIEQLIAATKVAILKIPELLVLIGGQGPMAKRLQELIRDSGLERNIRLLGFIPDCQLANAYRGANISIVPSETLEGFGLIAVESLAAGTPPLVTPVGGLPEVVRGLSSDLVMQGTNFGEIADRIVAALAGRLRLPTEAECIEFATSNFDWSVVTPKILQIYAEAL